MQFIDNLSGRVSGDVSHALEVGDGDVYTGASQLRLILLDFASYSIRHLLLNSISARPQLNLTPTFDLVVISSVGPLLLVRSIHPNHKMSTPKTKDSHALIRFVPLALNNAANWSASVRKCQRRILPSTPMTSMVARQPNESTVIHLQSRL